MKKYDLDKEFEYLPIKSTGILYNNPIGKFMGTELKTKVIQFNGMEIVLFEDGTYVLSDTTGG